MALLVQQSRDAPPSTSKTSRGPRTFPTPSPAVVMKNLAKSAADRLRSTHAAPWDAPCSKRPSRAALAPRTSSRVPLFLRPGVDRTASVDADAPSLQRTKQHVLRERRGRAYRRCVGDRILPRRRRLRPRGDLAGPPTRSRRTLAFPCAPRSLRPWCCRTLEISSSRAARAGDDARRTTRPALGRDVSGSARSAGKEWSPPPSRAGLASSYVGRDGNPPVGSGVGFLAAIPPAPPWPSSAPAFFWVRSSPSDGAWGGSRGGAARIRPVERRRHALASSDALVHGRWDAPAGDESVRDLTDEGLAHWPKNPQLLGIRALAGERRSPCGTGRKRKRRRHRSAPPRPGGAGSRSGQRGCTSPRRRLVARAGAFAGRSRLRGATPGNGCRSPWGASFGRPGGDGTLHLGPRRARSFGRAAGRRATGRLRRPHFGGGRARSSMGPVFGSQVPESRRERSCRRPMTDRARRERRSRFCKRVGST